MKNWLDNIIFRIKYLKYRFFYYKARKSWITAFHYEIAYRNTSRGRGYPYRPKDEISYHYVAVDQYKDHPPFIFNSAVDYFKVGDKFRVELHNYEK